MFSILIKSSLFVLALGSLSACAGNVAAPLENASGVSKLGTTGGRAASPTGLVYISDLSYGTVWIYSQKGHHQTPVGSLTGFGTPSGIAIDSSGNVYVADQCYGRIDEFYASGGSGPVFDVQAHLTDIAVDAAGKVYAIDGSDNKVYIWTAQGAPSTTLTSAFPLSYDLAIDSKADIFVSGGPIDGSSTRLEEFPAGSTQPQMVPGRFGRPETLAFDGRDNLLEYDYKDREIKVFAPPYTGKPMLAKRSPSSLALALNQDGSVLWETYEPAVAVSYPRFHQIDALDYPPSTGFAPNGLAVSPALQTLVRGGAVASRRTGPDNQCTSESMRAGDPRRLASKL